MSIKTLEKEDIPKGEERDISEIITIMRDFLKKKYPPGETVRHFHPKMHGCLKAQFVVKDTIPDDKKVGLFKEAKTYDAWIRFSNAPPTKKSDKRATSRGMAIKVLGVEGEVIEKDEIEEKTQNFLMTTSPVLSVGNVKNYKKAIYALTKGPLRMLLYGINPFNWRVIAITLLRAKKHTNLLNVEYFTGSPFLFGNKGVVKFCARPQKLSSDKNHKKGSSHFLRERLVEDLRSRDAVFDFLVQFQNNPKTEPIENTSIEWKSTFYKVAEIHIPIQVFNYQSRIIFGENLFFSPWQCLKDHKPLGGINRARKAVYQSLSEYRKKRNGVNKE
ncbi:catalase family protein [Aquimarina sediminis]|uniref:catalase family protein n=1 Tax=Aquimarina sediminis TaxID=2070536 RepID=UPI000CA0355D|nr:catalase family protein [Aquimarina sediminis]